MNSKNYYITWCSNPLIVIWIILGIILGVSPYCNSATARNFSKEASTGIIGTTPSTGNNGTNPSTGNFGTTPSTRSIGMNPSTRSTGTNPSTRSNGTNPSTRSNGVTFSGFVKTDAWLDTRNTVSVREGQFMLFPMKKELDADGKDINRNTRYNMVAIQTRLAARINGPDAFGARTSGLVEAAFFGSTDANINTLRLRHAWLKLDWEKTSLLIGQDWHPLFITQSFPGTVSFSTGAPFQPFSRNPQIRLTHSRNKLTFLLAAMSQRDFSGPGGPASLQNAAIPNLHAQVRGSTANILAGIGVDFKRLDIDPQQFEPVNSLSYFGFLNIRAGSLISKSYLILGENLQDHTMIGGVARAAGGTGIFPYQTLSLWHEWTTGFRGDPEKTRYELGIFTGYSQNLGTRHDAVVNVAGFARGADIDHLYRIAPRAQIQSGPVRFSLESDITTAAYGDIRADGTVSNTHSVTNIRLLFGAWLFF